MWSLPSLWTRFGEMTDVTIEVEGDVEQVKSMVFDKNVQLNGGGHTLTINEKETARSTESGLFGVRKEAEVNSMKVEIEALTSGSLFECSSSSSLTLIHSSITPLVASIAGCLVCVKEGASLVVTNTSFSSVSSTHSLAGVIVAKIKEGYSFKLDNVTFSSCSCSGRSRCVWMELVNTTSSPSFDYSMTDLKFEESSARTQNTAESTSGIDVYLFGSGLDSIIKSDLWEGSWAKSKERSLWAEDSKSGVNSSILPYIVDIENTVEVDETGWLFSKCGHFLLYCDTLGTGLSRMKSANLGSMTIITSAPLSSRLEAKGVFSIVGKTSTSTLSLLEDGQIDVVRDGLLESHLTLNIFSLVFSSTRPSTSFITSTACSLSLLACSLSSASGSVLNVLLIEVLGGSLDMNGVTSSLIKTTTSLFSTSSSVVIDSCSFEHVSRSSDGPSILVATLSATSPVSMKNTKMVGSVSNGKTQWVLLKGGHAESETEESWTGTFNASCALSGVMIERDASTLPFDSKFNPYSLLYCFHPRTAGEIVVETTSSSADHPLCGNVKLPCRTVDAGYGLTLERCVKIAGNGELGSRMEFDGFDVAVRSLRHSGSLLVVGKGQIVNGEANGLDSLTVSELVVNVDGSTLTSDEGVFENRGGILVLSKVNVSSSSEIGSLVVKLSGGKLTLTNSNFTSLSSSCALISLSSFESAELEHVSVSNWKGSTFLTASNGKSSITMQNCVFDGVLENSESNGEDLCSWSGGMVRLENTSSSLMWTSFTQIETGALVVDGGSVSLHSSAFEDNSAGNWSFPSFHRNIGCRNGGKVSIQSLSGGDGTKDRPSAWISSDCSVSGQLIDVDAPLFIPTLADENCSSTKDSKTSTFEISVEGTQLIPCGLLLEIFSKDNESESTEIDLSSAPTTFWNETHLNLTISQKTDLSMLTEANEWRGRLKYGNGCVTSNSFVVKELAGKDNQSELKKAMKIFIPIIIAVVVALAVVLLIVIILCCRRKNKKAQKDIHQSDIQELDQVDIKVEEYDENNLDGSMNMIKANSALTFTDHRTDSSDAVGTDAYDAAGLFSTETDLRAKGELMTVMKCGQEKVEETTVEIRDTLYSRLHRPNLTLNPAPLNKPQLKQMITEAMNDIARTRPTAEILRKLTSHWILFDVNGDVLFRLEQMNKEKGKEELRMEGVVGGEAEVEGATQKQVVVGEKGEVRHNDEQRWVPPEEADGKEIVDTTHGTVFRLGLVLWEIETGLVPFGEIDGINAQRQLGSGFIRDPYHGNEGSGRQSNVDSNQIESKKNKEIDRAVIVESAVTVSTDSAPSSIVMFCDSSYLAVQLDGLGVVIKDGLITISPRVSGEVSECGEKDECCSSVSVGLKTGLNQKQVDEKIILSIVHSSAWVHCVWWF
ncbi:hypothetical protein BLNAU_13818 [Blattamonas nauphoetae]|uniref:Uncharacterized protein n=1 Tax=Blattamonas nauphoetae TaxID=2049346 RepID=A0ABQ9XFF4_9EUKA|nr:hypothetical protein BLNAU_13818 [Blattamonas nauphoetae]